MKLGKLTPFKMNQHINRREKTLFLGVALVSSFVFFKTCILDTGESITKLKEEVATLNQERDTLANELSVFQQHSGQKKGSERDFVSSAAAIEQSLGAIARPLNTQGVHIVKTDFAETSGGQDAKKAAKTPAEIKEAAIRSLVIQKNATFSVAGNFEAVGRYVDYLEQLPAPFVIDRFSFNADENILGKVHAEIHGGFYALK